MAHLVYICFSGGFHYENRPTHENFHKKNFDVFLIFAQNIDCGCTLEPPRRGEAVLTSTHNLCFGAKIRKIGIPPHAPVLLCKSGV